MNRREERDTKRANRLNEHPRLLKAGDAVGHYAGFMIGGVFFAVGDWQLRHSYAEFEADDYEATHIAYFDGASIDYEDISDTLYSSPHPTRERRIQGGSHKSAIVVFFSLTITAIAALLFLLAQLAIEGN
jgi:hypothetical protein